MTDGPIETGAAEAPAPSIQDFDPANEQPKETESFVPVDDASPWAEVLADVPAEYHKALNEKLSSYTDSVKSPYEPYGFLLENEIDPETAQYAMNMLFTLNSDPRQLYDAIGTYYKFNGTPTDASSEAATFEPEDAESGPVDPRIAKLEQDLQTVAQILVQERQAANDAAEDKALESELNGLREKYGEFDEQYVLGVAVNGTPLDTAVRNYKALETRLGGSSAAAGQKPPVVMGSGGGAPAQNAVDPRTLSDKDTKSLVAQILQNANQE